MAPGRGGCRLPESQDQDQEQVQELASLLLQLMFSSAQMFHQWRIRGGSSSVEPEAELVSFISNEQMSSSPAGLSST